MCDLTLGDKSKSMPGGGLPELALLKVLFDQFRNSPGDKTTLSPSPRLLQRSCDQSELASADKSPLSLGAQLLELAPVL